MSLVLLKVSSKAAQVPGQQGRCTLTSHTPVHVPQCYVSVVTYPKPSSLPFMSLCVVCFP